ncbi:MAG: hypothetical protein ACRD4L_06340, partial [Pyrinomonadaceae bacterium]
TRGFLLNWRVLPVILLTYIAMLAAMLAFGATSLAVLWQVIVTFITLVLIPILFFLFQAMCVSFTISGTNSFSFISRSFHKFWRLLVVTLVMALVAFGLYYGVNSLEGRFTKAPAISAGSASEVTVSTPPLTAQTDAQAAAQAVEKRWFDGRFNIFGGLRFLLFAVAFPLITIHLWIALVREKLRTVRKQAPRIMLHAFGFSSLITYLLGMIIFALIPYYLIFTRTRSGNEWIEIGLLGGRLTLAAIFILVGWVLTLGSLSSLHELEEVHHAEVHHGGTADH